MKIWHDDTLTLPLPKAASVRSKMTFAHIRPRPHDGFTVKKGRGFEQTQVAVRANVQEYEVIQGHYSTPVSSFSSLTLISALKIMDCASRRVRVFASPLSARYIKAWSRISIASSSVIVLPPIDLSIFPLSGGVNGR
jgi:hypothetical protein